MKSIAILTAAALLALTGCGGAISGGEDFAVEVAASPANSLRALSDVEPGTAATTFPGMTFGQSRPSENEVVFAIPMKAHHGAKPQTATIRFRLESRKEGKGTVIHTTVDVPPIPMLMGKANMVLSEARVERELKRVLAQIGKNFAGGSHDASTAAPLSDLMVAVAIAGNGDYQAMVNQNKLNPGGYSDMFGDMAAAQDMPVDTPARDIESDPDTVERPAERDYASSEEGASDYGGSEE